jgi:hypothetical protein
VTKQLRTGDPMGAVLFTAGRLRGVGRLLWGAATTRSRLRLRLALAELRGFASGLARGIGQAW